VGCGWLFLIFTNRLCETLCMYAVPPFLEIWGVPVRWVNEIRRIEVT